MCWLEKEARGKELYFCMVGCLVLQLAQVFSVIAVFHFFEIGILSTSREKISIFTFSFLIMLPVGAFIEEIIFRLPLAVVIEDGQSVTRVLVAALVLSAIFGVIHGGVYHILIQGVWGFIISILFLKCGGLQRNYRKAVAVTTTIHFFFNATLVGIVIAGGGTSI